VRKEAYRWNPYTGLWECSSHLNFTYSAHTMMVEYARWNGYKGIYDAYTERAVYTLKNDGAVAFYSYYKKESPASDWRTVVQLTEIPSGIKWIENQLLLTKLP
jgi:hypothetical protein